MTSKTSAALLLSIMLLALLLRIPGLFWGVKLFSEGNFVAYHPDEHHLAAMDQEFLRGQTDPNAHYPKGFLFQMAVAVRLLKPNAPISESTLLLTGRVISIFYGIMSVVLIYFLAKELMGHILSALIASLFLSLSGLHVTQSHYATTDIGNTFWICATIYFSWVAIRTKKNPYFILALLSVGNALAFKLAWVSLIPIVYFLTQQKKKLGYVLLTLFCLLVIFAGANGGHFTWTNLINILRNVSKNNIHAVNHHNYFLNPLVYFIEFIPGLGLPIFLLALYGTKQFFNQATNLTGLIKKDLFFIVILPVILHIISVCFLAVPFPRHILPLIPFLTILSAHGFDQLLRSQFFKSKTRSYLFFSLILIYQLLYISSTEYYFFNDTRDHASTWIKINIASGEEMAAFEYVNIPLLKTNYKTSEPFKSRFLILHELDYRRFIRNEVTPLRRPRWDEVYHGKNEEYFYKTKDLLENKLEYKLIKKFTVSTLTPELLLYKKLWGTYSYFIGDTLLYQKSDFKKS